MANFERKMTAKRKRKRHLFLATNGVFVTLYSLTFEAQKAKNLIGEIGMTPLTADQQELQKLVDLGAAVQELN